MSRHLKTHKYNRQTQQTDKTDKHNRQTQNKNTNKSPMDLPGLPEEKCLIWVGGRGDRELSRQIGGFTAAELHTWRTQPAAVRMRLICELD